MNNIEEDMMQMGRAARDATDALRLAGSDQKAKALRAMATHIRATENNILTANAVDMAAAHDKGLSGSMLDRLRLNADRVAAMANGLEDIAALPDPVGRVDSEWDRPNGLRIAKVRVPIGVIGMIYESRPNVTADAGALCVKSGNAVILRGGSESAQSSRAIHEAMLAGLRDAELPTGCVQLVETTDRAAVGYMLAGLNGTIDVIIPRGGKGLVQRVQRDARVPVFAHLEGLNHSYIHAAANLDMAVDIVENAKLRRTGVCGSTETILVDAAVAQTVLPKLADRMGEACEFRANAAAKAILPHAKVATAEDYATEYLAPIMNIVVVDNIDAALAHIATYASGHTDAIITEDETAAARFLNTVDSAIVMHNASTQFADGGEFGFGAEIGIATSRLHARGPVGAEHLTSYKYQLRGTGQVRP